MAAIVTDRWLEFSAGRGNDLRSILRGGQAWCLCAERWTEAVDAWRAGELQKEDVPKYVEIRHSAADRQGESRRHTHSCT